MADLIQELENYAGTPEGASKGHLTQGHEPGGDDGGIAGRQRTMDNFRSALDRAKGASEPDRNDIYRNFLIPKLQSAKKAGLFSDDEIKDLLGHFKQKLKLKFSLNEEAALIDDEKKLETVDIPAIEVFSEGIWNGDKYESGDLRAMVDAFPVVGFEPTCKAGHADGQEDEKQARRVFGAPALGYVKRLWVDGKKLFAELKQVPKRFADLIKAGAFKRVSAEIYWNYKHESGEKTYPRVLKSIAFLGAEIPALTDLKAIESLYHKNTAGALYAYDERGNEFRSYSTEKEEPNWGWFKGAMDKILSYINSAENLKEYTIEKRDGKFCLIAKSTGKTLGCHDTEEGAIAQERAVQANKNADSGTAKIIFGGGLTIGAGGKGGVEKEFEIPWTMDRRGNYAVDLPEGTVSALCGKFGEDEGFRTRCMPWAEEQGMREPGAFCNALKQECFEAAQRAKQHGRSDMKFNLSREEVSKLCPPCGKQMEEKGISALSFTAEQVAKFAEPGDMEKCMAKADMVEKYPDENARKTACGKAMGEAMMQAIQEVKGGPTMDEKKFQEEKVKLEADKQAAEQKAREYQDKLAALEAANEEAKSKESEALKEVKKLQRKAYDTETRGWIKDQKVAGKIAPVEEPRLAAIFDALYEDTRVVEFSQDGKDKTKQSLAEAVKEFIVKRPSIFKEYSQHLDEPEDESSDPQEAVDKRTKDHMVKHGMKIEQYAEAMKAVLAQPENAELKIAYLRSAKQ